jgi:hypothetical protein
MAAIHDTKRTGLALHCGFEKHGSGSEWAETWLPDVRWASESLRFVEIAVRSSRVFT